MHMGMAVFKMLEGAENFTNGIGCHAALAGKDVITVCLLVLCLEIAVSAQVALHAIIAIISVILA